MCKHNASAAKYETAVNSNRKVAKRDIPDGMSLILLNLSSARKHSTQGRDTPPAVPPCLFSMENLLNSNDDNGITVPY